MFSTEFVNETFNSFTYGDLKSIKASPLDPNATVGYFIALT